MVARSLLAKFTLIRGRPLRRRDGWMGAQYRRTWPLGDDRRRRNLAPSAIAERVTQPKCEPVAELLHPRTWRYLSRSRPLNRWAVRTRFMEVASTKRRRCAAQA